MKLLSVGAVTPQGASIREHLANAEGLEKKIDFQTYMIGGKKRKIAVHRACEPQVNLPVPDGVLRRMGLSTKLVLSSIEDAKQRASTNFEGKRVGLIVGTTQGPSSTNIDYFRKLVSFQYRGASPNLFAQSVHNNIASSVALTYEWKGPTLTLVQETNLLSSSLNVADLWLKEKSVDFVWLILGNETSLHIPYIQLYEQLERNPGLEEYLPPFRDFSYEAFSAFLIGTDKDSGADFSFQTVAEALKKMESKMDRALSKPELMGAALAEYYFKEYF